MNRRKTIWTLVAIFVIVAITFVVYLNSKNYGPKPELTVLGGDNQAQTNNVSGYNSVSDPTVSNVPAWANIPVSQGQEEKPFSFKDYVAEGYMGTGCVVKKKLITLSGVGQNTNTVNAANAVNLSFDYADCPRNGYSESFKADDKHIALIQTNTSPMPAQGTPENEPYVNIIADYWILDPKQDSVSFIKSFISKLDSADERSHCVVTNAIHGDSLNSVQKRYQILPDDYLYKKMTTAYPDDMLSFCGEYGLTNGLQYFVRVGNVLLFLRLGQDVALFDPNSIRIVF